MFVLTLLTLFVFESSFFRSKLHIDSDSHWIWLIPFFFVGVVLLATAGTKSSDAEFEKQRSFEVDIHELQEVLDCTLSRLNTYSYEGVSIKVHSTLVWDAVWIRIYELTQNSRRAAEARKEMCIHYHLFEKFNFVPDAPSQELDQLPVQQFFHSAEVRVVETLNLALARQSRQTKGLPIQ